MEGIIEYSNVCDLVKGIAEINLDNSYRSRTQRMIVEELSDNMEINDGIKNEHTLHFQDTYNNMDKLLSIDYMECLLPLSEYLNMLINNYLLEQMLELMDFNEDVKKHNITQLIDFYHFTQFYIKSFYSYQEQLKQLENNPFKKVKVRQIAISKMNTIFNYAQFDKIHHFLTYIYKEVSFDKDYESYTNITPISKIFLIKIKVTIKQMLTDMKYFIENDNSHFNELKIYKKLELVIPLANIINLIFYILVKN